MLSIRDMAKALGVSKSQVARDKSAGMPMSTIEAARAWRLADKDPSRTVDGRIDRPHAVEAPRGADVKAPPSFGDGSSSPPSAADDDAVDENTAAYREHRARNERIRAERAELELQQLRGSLVAVRDVEQLQFTAGRITRDRVEMVAPRAAAELYALTLAAVPDEHRACVAARLELHTVERRLNDLLRDALNEAAQAIEHAARDDDDDDEARAD